MENITIIVLLSIILVILLILNNANIIKTTTTTTTTSDQASCKNTLYGCCPDGVNSKVNSTGSNCPAVVPFGYPQKSSPVIIVNRNPQTNPQPNKPIGGCSGTQYGCCPDNTTPKADALGSNCILHPNYPANKPIGGCSSTQYGCCPNSTKAKMDLKGSNC